MKQLSSLLKIIVSAFLLFLSLDSSGDNRYCPSYGAGEAGMGYACLTKNGFWSSFHNQALLSDYNSFSFGFNYECRFSVKELGIRSAAVTVPVGNATLGALYSHFGYSDFNRDMTGLACGLKLSDKISAGVQVDYYSERTPDDYDNIHMVTFEAGLLYIPKDNTRIGIHLFNPVPNSIRKRILPVSLRVGAGTELNQQLFAGFEIELNSGSNLIIRTGLEYEAVKKFWIRGGFCTSNNSFSFGVGYLVKNSQINVGFITHEKLGVSSSVSLIFKIH